MKKILSATLVATSIFMSSACFAAESSSVTVLGNGENDSVAVNVEDFSAYGKINAAVDGAINDGRCPSSARDSVVGAMDCAENLGLLGSEYSGWRDNDDKLVSFLHDNPAFDKYMSEDEINLLSGSIGLGAGAGLLFSGDSVAYTWIRGTQGYSTLLREGFSAFDHALQTELETYPNQLSPEVLKNYAKILTQIESDVAIQKQYGTSGLSTYGPYANLHSLYNLRAHILENMSAHLRNLAFMFDGGLEGSVTQSAGLSGTAPSEAEIIAAMENNLQLAKEELKSAQDFASVTRSVTSGTVNTAKAGTEVLKNGMDMQLFSTANPALEVEAVQAREVVAGGAEAGAAAGAFGWMTPAVMTAGAVGAVVGGALWAGASKLASWYQDEHGFIEDEMDSIRSGDSPD